MRQRAVWAAALASAPLLLGILAVQASATGLPQATLAALSPAATASKAKCATDGGSLGCPSKGGQPVVPTQLAPTVTVAATASGVSGGSPGQTTNATPGQPAPLPFCPALASCQPPVLMQFCQEPAHAGTPCSGPPAGCPGPPNQTKYEYWAVVNGAWGPMVPSTIFCSITTPVNPQPFIDSVLLETSPDPVMATVNPYTGPLPLTLPVFLWVQKFPADRTQTKTSGTVSVTTTLTSHRFVWYMDDGPDLVVLPSTTDAGGPYPKGKVTYAFKHVGVQHVHLQVIWDVNWTAYDSLTGYTNGGTKQVEQLPRPQFDVNVVEAHAVLVG